MTWLASVEQRVDIVLGWEVAVVTMSASWLLDRQKGSSAKPWGEHVWW
jgi:hypothetical protein